MACDIQITGVEGIPDASGDHTLAIRVTGTATECDQLTVIVNCSGAQEAAIDNNVPVDASGNWLAEIKTKCRCRAKIAVKVVCNQDSHCSAQFDDLLDCGGCPSCNVTITTGDNTSDDVSIDECVDGKRIVTFTVNCSNPAGGTVVTQIDFGDGSFSLAQSNPVYAIAHAYTPPGPYNARLITILPADCPDNDIVIDQLDECPCLSITDVQVNVQGCAGSGNIATATVTAIVDGSAENCVFEWDFDDGPNVFTTTPSVTHTYNQGGSYECAVQVECGDCDDFQGFTVNVERCCPVLLGVTATAEGCIPDEGGTADITFVADIDPGGAAGSYDWDFGDGTTGTTSAPATTHTYTSAGTKTVTVTFTPDQANCSPTTVTTDAVVPNCNGDEDDDNEGGGGFGCFIARATLVIAAAIALLAALLITCIPAAATALAWIAGISGLIAIIAGIIWGIFCKKPCGWGLLITWQATLGAGIGALYFTTCCPSLWLSGGALVTAGIGMMWWWYKRCNITFCRLIAELMIVFISAIIPLISWLNVIPVLSACINPSVVAAVGTIVAALGLKAASCISDA